MSRSTILANIASDIANNTTGLIRAIHVRRNLMDLANNALMPEDVGQVAYHNYGTTANTVAQGNDSRIVMAVPNTRHIIAGTGLSGGGNLSSNVTINVTYGTTANTAAQGNDSRITGAVQKAGTGQQLTGEYRHTPHNYGNLGSSTITLNPANGLTGKLTRTSGSGTIAAPSGTPSGIYNMVIFIDGTSSTGSPSLSGFDNSDFGDDMPGSGQHAWLYVTCGPDAKTAKIEAIDY